MKNLIIAGFIAVVTSLFAIDEDCGCGSVANDVFYANAVRELDGAVVSTVMRTKFPPSAKEFRTVFNTESIRYPYDGMIRWETTKTCLWSRDILGVKKKYRYDSSDIFIPRQIVRTMERSSSDIEKITFNFTGNYSALIQAFRQVKKDYAFVYESEDHFLNDRMCDIANGGYIFNDNPTNSLQNININALQKKRMKAHSIYLQKEKIIVERESEAMDLCAKSLDFCIKHHQNPIAHFDRGLFYYLEGNTLDALDQINVGLEKLKDKDFTSFKEKALLIKGQSELEAGLYANAVLTLTELIESNPAHKEAYFERAVAYFETGEFDKSIDDFLRSEMKSDEKVGISFSPEYAAGLMEGIKKGFKEEFSDSLPVWAPIMGYGAWTALSNLPFLPTKIATATLSCIAAAGIYLAADQMTAELRELVTNWDHLTPHERGELSGYLIGKHGIDVFLFAGSAKLMETYRELKKANNLLTFELIAANESSAASLKARWKRIEKFKKDQGYIQTSFGKNSYPEHEIRDNLQKMGYSLPKRPEGIPQDCITRYSDKGCGISYHDTLKPNYNCDRFMPGNPQSPNPRQQQPYVIQKRNGHCLDKDGNKVRESDSLAHIFPDEYVFRPWDFKPLPPKN